MLDTRPTAVTRSINAPTLLEGDGFEVRRPIPARGLDAVGPFIMLDHFGPVDYAPGEAKGAPTHPHAGIETLTYLLEGRGHHLDSLGNSSTMGPGDAQWMRAGGGIIHDEGADAVFQKTGGRNHGVQLWLNMPRGRRQDPPAYRQIDANEIPVFASGDADVRLIAGSLSGHTGPLETLTHPFLAHVTVRPNGRVRLHPGVEELGVYLLSGSGRVGGAEAVTGRLNVMGRDAEVEIVAGTEGADMLVLGGPPLDAPIVRYGPFVMNSNAELQAAINAYNAGRFGRITRTQGVHA